MQEVNQKNISVFGLFSALILVSIGVRIFYKFHSQNFIYFETAGACIAVISLFFWPLLAPVYRTWMKITGFVGWFNTRVILVIFFYSIIMPIGLLFRILGKDLLGLRIDKNSKTYWVKREPKNSDPKQYEKQY